MAKKKILIIQYKGILKDECLNRFGMEIDKIFEERGYIVSDERATFTIAEIDGIHWEKTDGSL